MPNYGKDRAAETREPERFVGEGRRSAVQVAELAQGIMSSRYLKE